MNILRCVIVAILALALVGSGGWIDTVIQPDTSYIATCEGGVTGVEDGWDNDVWVTCAWSPDEHVICSQPGVVGWGFGSGGDVVVTCDAPPK